MRQYKLDTAFRARNVIKTPFRGDVARVYLRRDNRIVVQHLGTFVSVAVPGTLPMSAVLRFADDTLDKWDSFN